MRLHMGSVVLDIEVEVSQNSNLIIDRRDIAVDIQVTVSQKLPIDYKSGSMIEVHIQKYKWTSLRSLYLYIKWVINTIFEHISGSVSQKSKFGHKERSVIHEHRGRSVIKVPNRAQKWKCHRSPNLDIEFQIEVWIPNWVNGHKITVRPVVHFIWRIK